MPLIITRRRSTGALTISGTVAGQRVQRRAQSDNLALAREEAAALEISMLRTEWHGERRGARSLDEAIVSYLEAEPRSEHTKAALRRIRAALGHISLGQIDQETASRLRRTILARGRKASDLCARDCYAASCPVATCSGNGVVRPAANKGAKSIPGPNQLSAA